MLNNKIVELKEQWITEIQDKLLYLGLNETEEYYNIEILRGNGKGETNGKGYIKVRMGNW